MIRLPKAIDFVGNLLVVHVYLWDKHILLSHHCRLSRDDWLSLNSRKSLNLDQYVWSRYTRHWRHRSCWTSYQACYPVRAWGVSLRKEIRRDLDIRQFSGRWPKVIECLLIPNQHHIGIEMLLRHVNYTRSTDLLMLFILLPWVRAPDETFVSWNLIINHRSRWTLQKHEIQGHCEYMPGI